MKISKFALKLLGTHALMTVIQFFMYLIFFSILQSSEVYQWFIGLFFIALFWLVIYSDASQYGENDLKRDCFYPSKGFLAGLMASIPGMIIYVAAVLYSPVDALIRIWLIPYVKFFIAFPGKMPHMAILFIALFPIVSGLSYKDGVRRRNKILKAIEKKDAMRGELSKRNS